MDTLKIADEREREGVFPGDKARAFARIMADAAQENLATKQDVKDLETALRGELRAQINDFRATMYRALFVQFLAIIGVVTAIVKL